MPLLVVDGFQAVEIKIDDADGNGLEVERTLHTFNIANEGVAIGDAGHDIRIAGLFQKLAALIGNHRRGDEVGQREEHHRRSVQLFRWKIYYDDDAGEMITDKDGRRHAVFDLQTC